MSNLPDIVRLDHAESPDRTRDLGNLLEGTVRALGHATLGDALGLEIPADADRVLRSAEAALQHLPQVLEQVRAWLDDQACAAMVGHDEGRDVSRSVGVIGGALISASGHLATAADVLHWACERTSHLTGLGGSDE